MMKLLVLIELTQNFNLVLACGSAPSVGSFLGNHDHVRIKNNNYFRSFSNTLFIQEHESIQQ